MTRVCRKGSNSAMLALGSSFALQFNLPHFFSLSYLDELGAIAQLPLGVALMVLTLLDFSTLADLELWLANLEQ